MINSLGFAERLKKVMDYYDLTASLLAEKISIQRSSISHLLSGRNKPSLDFVLKILDNFPEVELYWLLNGKGTFPKKNNEEVATTNRKPEQQEIQLADVLKSSTKSPIDRIVIFFKDGTFKDYIS